MNNDNYYLKYLKYKQKYLKLKNKELIGGANCPQSGFHQHIFECAHDSLLMILLYSDNYSERIQTLFDNTNFNIDECISAANSPLNRFFMPIQIDSPHVDDFYRYSKQYIKNIFERYENDKLPYSRDEKILSLSSRAAGVWPIYPIPSKVAEQRELPTKHRDRRDSINESLSCNFALMHLTNINMIEEYKKTYSHNIGRASYYFHQLTTISLFNYYLTNYRPSSIFHESSRNETNQFLSMRPFNLPDIFFINELEHLDDFRDIIEQISERLDNIFNKIKTSRNLLGINLSLKNIDSPDSMGHNVSFMKCNDVEKFYDSNGIFDEEGEESDQSQLEDTPELVKYPDYYMEKTDDVMRDYRWKDYLLDTISKCQERLIELERKDKAFIITSINKLFQSFSRLFMEGICCGKYLNKYFIETMSFIFINDVSSEHNREEEYIDANMTNILEPYASLYTNDRTYDLISKTLMLLPEMILPDEFKNLFFRLAQNKNYIILEKLIKDHKFNYKFKLECILLIINDILDQPYDEINKNLIEILLKSIRELDIRLLEILYPYLNTRTPSYRDYAELFRK